MFRNGGPITNQYRGDFNKTVISQNGGPKLNFTGLTTPDVYFSKPYTISTSSAIDDPNTNHLIYRHSEEDNQLNKLSNFYSSSTDDPNANHLIYRRSKEDNQPNILSNFYSSSGKSSLYVQKFDTVHQPPSSGISYRETNDYGGSRNAKTLGRNDVLTFFKNPAFSTVTGRAYKRFGGTKRISRKEDCISFIDIETDRVSTYQYRPGEEVSGKVTLIVRHSLEIRFVDLVVTGYGHITTRAEGETTPHTTRETYLHKEKCIIGCGDLHLSSVLMPGRYTSQFRVKLPRELPSSIHHEDRANGLTLNISYTLKVRVCEDVGPRSPSHVAVTNRIRVLLEKQIYFNVQRDFDLSTVPDAMSPIVHEEQVFLACAHQEAATVAVNIDRAVFLAGDDIRMHLRVSLPNSQSVKDIICRLQEHIVTNPRHEPLVFTLSKITRKDDSATNQYKEKTYVINIPTQTHWVSQFSLGNSQFRISYFLSVDLRFIPAGGKLSFKIPISLGPCAEPIYAEKISSSKAIPLFNRTIRFPCFSTRTLPSSSSSEHPSTTKSAASVVVTTKYSNGLLARCFLCCTGQID